MGKSMEKAAGRTEASKPANAYRFERKFVFPHEDVEDFIETKVLLNSYCFSEIFERRQVNNIYFDYPELHFYKQNVEGDGERKKYRLRWYGDTFEQVNKPSLEIKKKFGEVGDKITVKLKDLSMNLASTSSEEAYQQILQEIEAKNQPALVEQMRLLTPSLYNAYERRYFLSDCERFRITVDYNMKFYNPDIAAFKISKARIQNIVLELKYEREFDEESRMLTQEIDARLSKNSKYVQGVDISI